MGARRVRFAVVAGLAAVTMFGLASSAPGSASAVAELTTLSGLEAVNYGQVAAYSARIENTGNVTLKNVTLRNPIPFTVVDGQPRRCLPERRVHGDTERDGVFLRRHGQAASRRVALGDHRLENAHAGHLAWLL